jgi:hypothetical protein
MVNSLLKQYAISVHLDPARLVPHSLRVGSTSQLDAHSAEERCIHGNWKTVGGMMAYMRPGVGHGNRTAAALHDHTSVPLELARVIYMTPRTAVRGAEVLPR